MLGPAYLAGEAIASCEVTLSRVFVVGGVLVLDGPCQIVSTLQGHSKRRLIAVGLIATHGVPLYSERKPPMMVAIALAR